MFVMYVCINIYIYIYIYRERDGYIYIYIYTHIINNDNNDDNIISGGQPRLAAGVPVDEADLAVVPADSGLGAIRPILVLRFSLLRFVDSRFLGNANPPLKIRLCLSRTL